jgi:membrane protease YdiL (CAAX protease family)
LAISAPASFTFLPNRTWRTLVTPIALCFMLVTGSFLLFRLWGQEVYVDHLVRALPIIILFPIVNAINEEVRFRNVFFAAGTSQFNRKSLLQLTTVLFGLAHFGSYLGTSGTGGNLASGLAYALGAAALGWINGTATLDTKGIAAAWIIHAASDLVIIVGYALV